MMESGVVSISTESWIWYRCSKPLLSRIPFELPICASLTVAFICNYCKYEGAAVKPAVPASSAP